MARSTEPRRISRRGVPHACGDGPGTGLVTLPYATSSPRLWGWLVADDRQLGVIVEFPTPVGMARLTAQCLPNSLLTPCLNYFLSRQALCRVRPRPFETSRFQGLTTTPPRNFYPVSAPADRVVGGAPVTSNRLLIDTRCEMVTCATTLPCNQIFKREYIKPTNEVMSDHCQSDSTVSSTRVLNLTLSLRSVTITCTRSRRWKFGFAQADFLQACAQIGEGRGLKPNPALATLPGPSSSSNSRQQS